MSVADELEDEDVGPGEPECREMRETLGARLTSYVSAEQYFTEIARESGRTPWEVDRLLYHFSGDALDAIAGRANKDLQPTAGERVRRRG